MMAMLNNAAADSGRMGCWQETVETLAGRKASAGPSSKTWAMSNEAAQFAQSEEVYVDTILITCSTSRQSPGVEGFHRRVNGA
jgi:hypothetical protein